ncbi:MAG: DUF3108 domain-containing protein [Muribaculum sp.]|nr:DUF3108 domain-containing protein [Muribaculaceae bacterium]MCM1081269.1 DUF3108 domain-containing protein [Muribaculum sp.]
MTNCFKYLIVFIAILLVFPGSAVTLPDEDLHYSIMYKWGLINKEAGTATLSLRKAGNKYNAMLAARTVPWADKVFRVRDTLKTKMDILTCAPTEYIKLTHEGNLNKVDRLTFRQIGNTVTVNAHRQRQKNDGPVIVSDTVLYGSVPAVDMLSVYYYMRQIDFPSMKLGSELTFDVFSGKKVERLTLIYRGPRTIKIDGRKHNTYEVTFTFTQNGKESDAPMYSWISADDQRIPIKLEGQLPFGKVQAFCTGSTLR